MDLDPANLPRLAQSPAEPSAEPQAEHPAEPLVFPPVQARHRGDGWTAERQRAFLEALASSGSVTSAARSVGMSRETAYALRRRADARGFAQAWDAARALAAEHLTELAWDRAVNGTLYHIPMIPTHEDGFWRFSARSVRSGDVVHRPECATLSECRQKPPPVAISRPLDFVAASPR